MRLDLTTLNLVLAIEQTRSITRGAERERKLHRLVQVAPNTDIAVEALEAHISKA